MGKVRAQMTGFIGVDGRSVHIEEGDEFDSDHEFVIARPDVFGEVGAAEPAAPKRRGRPPRDG